MKIDVIYNEDCLEGMPKRLSDKSIDMVLCDLPYGCTACKWDKIIPLEPMWKQLRRIIKPHGAIVMTASQPFTSKLIMSNLKWFKYECIYEKTNPKGFLSANYRPLTAHENIIVFSNGKTKYNPQKWQIPEYLRTKRKHATSHTAGECYGGKNIKRWNDNGSRYPTSVIGFSNRVGRRGNYHPTQKPIALMEYLIKTYTNEDEIVLDFAIGSGTTAVACINLNRHYIGFDTNYEYCEIARKRLSKVQLELIR